jgi:hypothetical protein
VRRRAARAMVMAEWAKHFAHLAQAYLLPAIACAETWHAARHCRMNSRHRCGR